MFLKQLSNDSLFHGEISTQVNHFLNNTLTFLFLKKMNYWKRGIIISSIFHDATLTSTGMELHCIYERK